MSGAAVEEDLGGFCGVWGDFDDVGVSPAGTAASQRAFSAHSVAASLENMNLRSPEAVECYPGTMEERSNTSRAVVRLWLRSDFYLDFKSRMTPIAAANHWSKRRRTRFHQQTATHFYPSAGL